MQRLEGGARRLLKADFKAGLVSGLKGDESEKTSRVVVGGGGGRKDTGRDAGGWREEPEPESWSRIQPPSCSDEDQRWIPAHVREDVAFPNRKWMEPALKRPNLLTDASLTAQTVGQA